MDRLRNKLESYSVQIRRTERERMKHQMRQKIIESIAFDEVFEEFIAHKPHQVSK
jgi:ribosomal protein L16 Arg81 hydroxylase